MNERKLRHDFHGYVTLLQNLDFSLQEGSFEPTPVEKEELLVEFEAARCFLQAYPDLLRECLAPLSVPDDEETIVQAQVECARAITLSSALSKLSR